MMTDATQPAEPAPYAPALIRLLQGVVFTDDREIWDLVLRYEHPINAYFAQMGVALYCDEASGYAYLRQPATEDGDPASLLPRLTRRRELTYSTTLLLVLLREEMNQFDSTLSENTQLLLPHERLLELMGPFYSAGDDERAVIRKMEQDIGTVVDLGLLKKQDAGGQSSYLVRPVIKAFFNAETLEEVKARLLQHAHDESA